MAQFQRWTPLIVAALLGFPQTAVPKKAAKATSGRPMLWQDPVDIASRDLLHGSGGIAHQPGGKFKFIKEDLNGTNPKYVVSDENGTKWKIKLGEEARPETAAARLVWAAGYFADEVYFLPDVKVDNMPLNLHRGENLVEPDGLMHNARLKRYTEGEQKAGIWKWRDNPFTGTREFDGLRVLMALINNWDLKDENNAVYERDGNLAYLVSDLGASFGSTGRSVTRAGSKGNLDVFKDSKFISKVSPPTIDFVAPSRPNLIHVVEVPAFKMRVEMEWIGKQIPIEHARWLRQILGRLSTEQIHAAFGASGFSPKEIAGFTGVVQERIAELNRL